MWRHNMYLGFVTRLFRTSCDFHSLNKYLEYKLFKYFFYVLDLLWKLGPFFTTCAKIAPWLKKLPGILHFQFRFRLDTVYLFFTNLKCTHRLQCYFWLWRGSADVLFQAAFLFFYNIRVTNSSILFQSKFSNY